jgi:hypothetical protein
MNADSVLAPDSSPCRAWGAAERNIRPCEYEVIKRNPYNMNGDESSSSFRDGTRSGVGNGARH